jgi:hypothetical protein
LGCALPDGYTKEAELYAEKYHALKAENERLRKLTS